MIKSVITFYKTGLNGNNWAYDKAALTSILASAGISPVLALTRVLSFGTPFEITDEQYALYKTATYIKIENTDDASGTTITRYARIQNFLSIYTGGYTVAYTLDDWANYVLNATEFDAHIDGFVTHANLKLIKNNRYYDFDKCYGEFKDRLTVTEQAKAERNVFNLTYGQVLEPGFICALIKYKQPLYRGKEVKEKTYNRLYYYKDSDNNLKSFSALGYYGVQILHIYSGTKTYYTAELAFEGLDDHKIVTVAQSMAFAPNSDNIEQITYLPFFPSPEPTAPTTTLFLDKITDAAGKVTNYRIVRDAPTLTNKLDELKNINLYDIADKTTTGSYLDVSAIDIGYIFSTEYNVALATLIGQLDFKPYLNEDLAVRDFNIDTYYKSSRYRSANECMRLTIGYESAEIEISSNALKAETSIYCGLTPDLSSAYIRLSNVNQTISPLNTAISENLNVLLPPIGYNRESERNAKLTGYLSGATGILSGAGGLISGLATGNPGLIAGAAQSAIQGVNTLYKTAIMKTLTNIPANRDNFAVELVEKNTLYLAVSYPAEYAQESIFKQYEYTGIDTLYEINEYLQKEKCQAFNFVQCDQSIEVHGIPEEPAQRIAAALIQGVTLWTSSDVGNKKQINY